ncbi:DUF2975 domain-containing protein [Nocardiopsis halotolerans]|uniref:DUF2975 domain-containing protein n=1 Tax=Nocardiopsis halotolerans TaxID=124252 RepID=UPI00034836AE|nr:DUF2975 domain-containing protein [Nocardiopsis halotolerans]
MSLRRALSPRWSRADSVLLRYVLVVFLGAQAVHALFLVVWGAGFVAADTSAGLNVLTRPLPSDTPPPPVDVATHGDVTVEGVENMVLTFHDPSVAERLLLVAPELLTALAAGLVGYLLLRMAMTLAKGDPFIPANVRRMFAIALTVIVCAFLVPLTEALTGAELAYRVVETDTAVTLTLSLSLDGGILPLVLVGSVLAALAEVFRRGTQLRADVEGLV